MIDVEYVLKELEQHPAYPDACDYVNQVSRYIAWIIPNPYSTQTLILNQMFLAFLAGYLAAQESEQPTRYDA